MMKKNMRSAVRLLLPLYILSAATASLAQVPTPDASKTAPSTNASDTAKPVEGAVESAPAFRRSIMPKAPVRPEPSEAIKALEAKAKVLAEARWVATVNKDFEAVYQMLSPSSQQSVTKADYVTALAGRAVIKADVFSVACTADECTTIAYTTTKIPIPRVPSSGVLTTTEDRWIVSDGKLGLIVR